MIINEKGELCIKSQVMDTEGNTWLEVTKYKINTTTGLFEEIKCNHCNTNPVQKGDYCNECLLELNEL